MTQTTARTSYQIAYDYVRKIKPTLFDSGIGAKLPEEYKKFYNEWRNTPAEAVHYIPIESKWERDEETGEVRRIENNPIPGFMCKELNEVFTGGEMAIQGFIQKNPKKPRVPRFWMPITYKSVIYSEILDKYMSAITTKRFIDHIIDHRGLDTYILKTKACDLKTLVTLKLKRKLLLTLRDNQLPYDEEKNKIIFEKYSKYMLPPEEIEWYGLSFGEACQKFQALEEANERESIIPLKHIFRTKLIEGLKSGTFQKEKEAEEEEEEEEEREKPWYKKLPGMH